jgi:protein TonB
MTEAGWSLALGVSIATHAAVVLASGGPFADTSPAAVMLAPPCEVEIDAVRPVAPADENPLPDRVDPSARRASPRNAPSNPQAAPRAQPLDPAPGSMSGAPTIAAPESEMPHFAIAIAPSVAVRPRAPVPFATAHSSNDADPVFAERAVDVPARLSHGEPPAYPAAARADGLEGDVLMELVVSPFGEVESARVSRPVGHGLDEAAVVAARRFRFAPAVKEGRPVRVRVSWTMQFRLR